MKKISIIGLVFLLLFCINPFLSFATDTIPVFMAKEFLPAESDNAGVMVDAYKIFDQAIERIHKPGEIYSLDNKKLGIVDIEISRNWGVFVCSGFFNDMNMENWDSFFPVTVYVSSGEIFTIAGFNSPETRKMLSQQNESAIKAYSFFSYYWDDKHGPGLGIKAPDLSATITGGVPVKAKVFQGDKKMDAFMVAEAENENFIALYSIFFTKENVKEWPSMLPIMVVTEKKHEFLIYRAVVWNDLKF